MSCKKLGKLWPRYLSGDLEGRRLSRFEAHLAACEACRARREAFDASRALVLQNLPGPADLNDIERARLKKSIPEAHPLYRLAPLIAALGATAAAVVMALVMTSVPTEPQPDAGTDASMEAIAMADLSPRPERYELRMNTSDPSVKIVWVFDRDLQL